MTTPRRRVIRPARTGAEESRRQQKLLRYRDRLQKEQQALARWMSKLRRAFHAMEKQQRRVAHLEREIAKLEQE